MKLTCLLFFALLFIYSCGFFSDPEPKKADPQGLLKDAKAFTYFELPDSIRKIASDGYTFAYLGETSQEIKKEKGYYVRIILDNKILADCSTNDTNLAPLLDAANYRALYGKYRNSPFFYDSAGNLIKITLKHENYDLFYIGRSGNTDTTFWGPVLARPVKVTLACSYLDSARQPQMAVH